MAFIFFEVVKTEILNPEEEIRSAKNTRIESEIGHPEMLVRLQNHHNLSVSTSGRHLREDEIWCAN